MPANASIRSGGSVGGASERTRRDRAESTVTRRDPECRLVSERTGHVRDIVFRARHEQRIRKPRGVERLAQMARRQHALVEISIDTSSRSMSRSSCTC